MIVVGRTYIFNTDEDCRGATRDVRGNRVVVLELYDCYDCWWVRCLNSGAEFYAHGDELHALADQPIMDDIEDESSGFYEGEMVTGQCGPMRGHSYRIAQLHSNGSISVSRWDNIINSYAPVDGVFPASCFRR